MTSYGKIVFLLLIAVPVIAPNPTHAALEHHTVAYSTVINQGEGVIYVDQQLIELFPQAPLYRLEKGDSLRTGEGWVEVQLSPNAFLWLGREGSLAIQEPGIWTTHLAMEQGTLIVRIYPEDPGEAKTKITIRFKEADVELSKPGLYRFDTGSSQVRVSKGKAKVQQPGNKVTIKKGNTATFGKGIDLAKSVPRPVDQIEDIAVRRSEVLYAAIIQSRPRQSYQPPYTSRNGSAPVYQPTAEGTDQIKEHERQLDQTRTGPEEGHRRYPPPADFPGR